MDVEGEIEAVAMTLSEDVVPGLEDIFSGVLHALGGLPIDRWDLTGVTTPPTPPSRDETLSFTAGNSFSSEGSEPADLDRAISGETDDLVTPADQVSRFDRGEAWTLMFDEEGSGRG